MSQRTLPCRPLTRLPTLAVTAAAGIALVAAPAGGAVLHDPAQVATALQSAPVVVSDDAGVPVDVAAVTSAVHGTRIKVAVVESSATSLGLQLVTDDIAKDLGAGGSGIVIVEAGTGAIAAAAQAKAPFNAGEATLVTLNAFIGTAGAPTAKLVAAVNAVKARGESNENAHTSTTGDIAAPERSKKTDKAIFLIAFVVVALLLVSGIYLLDRRRRVQRERKRLSQG